MAPPLEIAVPTSTTLSPPSTKPYTTYNISLRQPLRSYTVQKRYSDFVTLHAAIVTQCDKTAPPLALPQKTWLKSSVKDAELADSRRRGLEAYLRAINDASDPRWRNCAAWRSFLNLPAGADIAANGVGAKALQSADMARAGMDPVVWLDVHRDAKSALREARQRISAKQQASTPQRQHEESAEAKRALVRAGTMIGALERALKDEGTTKALGAGEVRRRGDLLSAAVKERDGLEENLSRRHLQEKLAANDHTSSVGGTDDGKGANTSQKKFGSRRVLGAPLKETERTKELDNAGVLQLQQQIMKEQEQDVEEITKTVQRMKAMGVQINDELQLQNEMLGLLDEDVGRVQDKVDIAKKRIGKIK